jgi:hypothetical protein
MYTQEGNKLNFLRNKNHLFKPQRGEINIAWGSAPGNPSYDHVEYISITHFLIPLQWVYGSDNEYLKSLIQAVFFLPGALPQALLMSPRWGLLSLSYFGFSFGPICSLIEFKYLFFVTKKACAYSNPVFIACK